MVTMSGEPPPVLGVPKLKMFHMTNFAGMNRLLSREFDAIGPLCDSGLAKGDCEFSSVQIENITTRAVNRFVPNNTLSRHRIIVSPAKRALQKHSRNLQRKLHCSPELLSIDEARRIRREISRTKNMILNSVSSETARFFTSNFNGVSSSRDAHNVLKKFTGQKSRPKINGSLLADSDKINIISGNDNIANALADRFVANHTLTITTHTISPHEYSVGSIRRFNNPIQFTADTPANIVTDKQLSEINSRLPEHQRGLLTSAEEVSHVVGTPPYKKSYGIDGVPYFIFKKTQFLHHCFPGHIFQPFDLYIIFSLILETCSYYTYPQARQGCVAS